MKSFPVIACVLFVAYKNSYSQEEIKIPGGDKKVISQPFDQNNGITSAESKMDQAIDVKPKSMLRRVCFVIGGSVITSIGTLVLIKSDEVQCNFNFHSMCNERIEGKKDNAAIPTNLVNGAILVSSGLLMVREGFKK